MNKINIIALFTILSNNMHTKDVMNTVQNTNLLKPGIYKHYKEKLYNVIAIGIHTETMEKIVIYQSLYNTEHFGDFAFWVRPVDMFLETIKIDGIIRPRFEFIPEKNSSDFNITVSKQSSIVQPGIYKHYKNKFYKVIAIGTHTETMEKVVIYQSLYTDPTFGAFAFWVRPVDMFTETIEIDGIIKPRFEFIPREKAQELYNQFFK